MFGWLRNLFGKKGDKAPEEAKAAEAKVQQSAAEVPEREVEEEATSRQKLEKMAAQEKEFGKDPSRPEKICPKCGAPNDQFVDVCWMCKERVY